MLPFMDKRLTLPPDGSGQQMQVRSRFSALRKTPALEATQVSQILFGETVILHHEKGDFGLVQSQIDGYVGWAQLADLERSILVPTHRVNCARLHAYERPAISAAARLALGLGARLTATGHREGRYTEFERAGWIVDHLVAPIDSFEPDPAGMAEQCLGTPYQWGGRDSSGLDCSGLVQIAFGACGVLCPRDSDMQYHWFGEAIEAWDRPGGLQRNDLVFWKGHVGIMLGAETLLHANGTFMNTIKEPLRPAVARIATEYGEPLGARRINLDLLRGCQPDWLIPQA